MKKILLLIALAGFFINAQGQQMKSTEVPGSVRDSFNVNYAAMQNVEWKKDGNNFSAAFKQNKLGRTVTYSATGNRIGMDEQIATTAVPNSVSSYLKENYAGKDMGSASKMTGADGAVTYKTNMDGKDLYFDSKGKYLKSDDK
jgi:hypothetical protein